MSGRKRKASEPSSDPPYQFKKSKQPKKKNDSDDEYEEPARQNPRGQAKGRAGNHSSMNDEADAPLEEQEIASGGEGEREDGDESWENMDGEGDEEDQQLVVKKKKPYRKTTKTNPNGRAVHRRLVSWKNPMDQLILIYLLHEMHAGGYEISKLLDNVIWRLTKDRHAQGQALQQHIEKLRHLCFEAGAMITPATGRDNCPTISRQHRGIIKVPRSENKQGWRFVEWDEDFDVLQNVDETCPFTTQPGTWKPKEIGPKHPGKLPIQKLKPKDRGFDGEPSIRKQQGFSNGDSDDEEQESVGGPYERESLEGYDSYGFKKGATIRRKKHGRSSKTIIVHGRDKTAVPEAQIGYSTRQPSQTSYAPKARRDTSMLDEDETEQDDDELEHQDEDETPRRQLIRFVPGMKRVQHTAVKRQPRNMKADHEDEESDENEERDVSGSGKRPAKKRLLVKILLPKSVLSAYQKGTSTPGQMNNGSAIGGRSDAPGRSSTPALVIPSGANERNVRERSGLDNSNAGRQGQGNQAMGSSRVPDRSVGQQLQDLEGIRERVNRAVADQLADSLYVEADPIVPNPALGYTARERFSEAVSQNSAYNDVRHISFQPEHYDRGIPDSFGNQNSFAPHQVASYGSAQQYTTHGLPPVDAQAYATYGMALMNNQAHHQPYNNPQANFTGADGLGGNGAGTFASQGQFMGYRNFVHNSNSSFAPNGDFHEAEQEYLVNEQAQQPQDFPSFTNTLSEGPTQEYKPPTYRFGGS